MAQTAFLFPGQGAQYVGMGRELCEQHPECRGLFEQAADVLGYSLWDVCVSGPPERLNSTEVSQPAIFVASLAALQVLRREEPQAEATCVATAGLSLGEYTALVFAGALDFADGLRVVQARGKAMQAASDANPSGMVSVLGATREQLDELIGAASAKGFLQAANFLCPGQIVVSGELAALDELERLVAEKNFGRTVRLSVAGAFHTHLMKPADERLAEALANVEIRSPRIPVWSNVDAQPHTDPEEIRSLLVRQVVQPVYWEDILRSLVNQGIEDFYEIGPGRVIAGLLKRIDRKRKCRNVKA